MTACLPTRGRWILSKDVTTSATRAPDAPETAPASRPPPAGSSSSTPPRRSTAAAIAAKRCVGDTVRVEVDAFRDGHDLIRVLVAFRGPGDAEWQEREMSRLDAHLGGVRWHGAFTVDRIGRWEYTIRAFTDTFGTWRDELERKVAAGQHDLAGELSEGLLLLEQAAAAAARPGGSEADRACARERRRRVAHRVRLATAPRSTRRCWPRCAAPMPGRG